MAPNPGAIFLYRVERAALIAEARLFGATNQKSVDAHAVE